MKYEVYGIILITLSVIAISGEAAVGRSLTKLFGFLLGIHYYLLAIAGIWIGLYVMIKRKWPRGWTSRRSGFVIVGLGMTLWSAMNVVDSSLGPIDGITPSSIFSQTMAYLREQLWQTTSSTELGPALQSSGGGAVGALQYSILYWLFGYYGAKFVMIIQFLIALLLITNRSYVEMGRSVRLFIMRVAPLLAARLSKSRKLLTAKAVPVQRASKKARPTVNAVESQPHLDEEIEEQYDKPKQKKPALFQIFQLGKEQEEDPAADDALYGEQSSDDLQHLPSGFRDEQPPEETVHIEQQDHVQPSEPRFTDFTEQAYADMEWKEHPTEQVQGETIIAAGQAVEAADDIGISAESDAADIGEHPVAAASSVLGEPVASPPPAPKPAPRPYRLPSIHLLEKPKNSGKGGSASDYMSVARKLEATLESFGVRAKVLDVARGPAVTRYELQPDVGVKVSRIVSLTDDIALALAAKDIRMEAPIPGKPAIGIEVPNNEVSVVTLREVIETPAFRDTPNKLTVAFGRDISGQPIVDNLAKMPHLLVAGATGSGKSVCINGIITSILYKAKPDEVKFLMVDPKMVELNVYNGIPHLLAPVVTDPKRAALALKKIVVEMEKRYEKFSKSGTRNIEGYNGLMLSGNNPDAVLPYIVVIVDELADLMMVAAGDVEDAITRLAQMARAAGIHLIIATQRPSVDVITGVIKANIPSRIAFGVSSQVDSRTILDMAGAEKLLGRGDMLFLPMGKSKPIRVQGAFLSDGEVEAVVAHARGQAEAEYDDDLVPEIDDSADENAVDAYVDELFDQAVQIVLEAKHASVSLLQRRMRIGYTRAARLIDTMEAKGIVGPYEGSKPREVLMSIEQYQGRISS